MDFCDATNEAVDAFTTTTASMTSLLPKEMTPKKMIG
jgi:hypothetical protein